MLEFPRRPPTPAEINMAPLIDMTFLLLIFFLVNAKFVQETGIEVNRPQAVTGRAQKAEVLLIGITAAGTLHVNNQRVELTAIRQWVASRRPGAGVVVVADERVSAGLLVRVVDQCRLAGAKDVAVATRAPATEMGAPPGGAP